MLESDLTELQSTHAEARMQIADLSEKLLVQTTIAEQLKVEYCSQNATNVFVHTVNIPIPTRLFKSSPMFHLSG